MGDVMASRGICGWWVCHGGSALYRIRGAINGRDRLSSFKSASTRFRDMRFPVIPLHSTLLPPPDERPRTWPSEHLGPVQRLVPFLWRRDLAHQQAGFQADVEVEK